MIGEFLNTDEAAELIGCVPAHVRRLRKDGKLKGEQVNKRSWVFPKSEVEKLADEYRSAPPNRGGRPRKTQ